MAKWGEGDPRWIVEERPDATNVNNWHWTEKNATPWSKDRFNQLFTNVKLEDSNIECIIESVDKCSGEATANNRKGKLIFFYEWELTLNWIGYFKNNHLKKHKGKATIPNLSEENDLDDLEITITIDESNEESEIVKQFMYNNGRNNIRKLLGVYIKELKEEYSKNLILPNKNSEKVQQINNQSKGNNIFNNGPIPNSSKVTTTLGCKLDVRTLTIEEEFQCTANDLYNALTKPDMVTSFTRAPAKVEASRGGEFHLYGGNVHGVFDELIPEKKLSLRWRLKSWPSGHYSNVVIELEEMKNCTQMKLKQTGIPASEYDTMKTNWNRYYWNSIKQTFGFGVPLADVL
ncbi:activator of 90 kDa heat shock protein ATPase homolog 1 [Musca vetustissima]|uniref:activator of 90 kDa heat shock protein ATPase homolog 1 n=1 Tax=Musca vetustissima TaxID=27455 RepID=UPI002AB67607|nr:activator of 90 kDa heat shock protein ATPase homolog 1 [Musca vetustissima]